MAVEVAQRQPAELGIDIRPQPEDRPLGDAGHDVALHPGEDRAHDVEADQENDDPSERPEVHAGRVEMEAAQQVRLLVLALGPE